LTANYYCGLTDTISVLSTHDSNASNGTASGPAVRLGAVHASGFAARRYADASFVGAAGVKTFDPIADDRLSCPAQAVAAAK
jgi:hypothetical protein